MEFLQGNNLHLKEIDSTNTLAKYLLGSNIKINPQYKEIYEYIKNNINVEEIDYISADLQTIGRGQRGNLYHTDINSLAITYILRPEEFLDTRYLTGRTALIVKNVLETTTDLTVDIKWINDIIYKDKKIGGILTESIYSQNKTPVFLVGIGLNVAKSQKSSYSSLELDPSFINTIKSNLKLQLYRLKHNENIESFLEVYTKSMWKLDKEIVFLKEYK